MRVGMLTSTSQRCGISDYSASLAGGLRKLVDLCVTSVWDQIEPWDAYLVRASETLNSTDVVHIQHEYSFWGSVLPGQNKFFDQVSSIKKPIVMTAHTLNPATEVLGLDLPGSFLRKSAKRALSMLPAYRRIIEQQTFEVADRIIIHDPGAESRLRSRGIQSSKIRIIPMGVPAPNPDPATGDAFRAQFRLAGKRLIVIFGFVRPGRGYEAALESLRALGSDVMLVIAGGPQTDAQQAYLDSLMADVSARGLRDRVAVTGYLSDDQVSGAMRAADVVLCSQEAGTGSYSVQVALGYGSPIVASDLPCFTYPEETHGCLLTFNRGDADDMAAKLKIVLDDAYLRAGLSDGALKYAVEHAWDKIAERTVDVYREVI